MVATRSASNPNCFPRSEFSLAHKDQHSAAGFLLLCKDTPQLQKVQNSTLLVSWVNSRSISALKPIFFLKKEKRNDRDDLLSIERYQILTDVFADEHGHPRKHLRSTLALTTLVRRSQAAETDVAGRRSTESTMSAPGSLRESVARKASGCPREGRWHGGGRGDVTLATQQTWLPVQRLKMALSPRAHAL